MRSAHDLQKNLTGIGILYRNGYHDQVRDSNGYMEPKFIRKRYSYLRDLGILFSITVHGAPVQVKVYLLQPDGTFLRRECQRQGTRWNAWKLF